jgi:P-type conjugative transfer protein TrbL
MLRKLLVAIVLLLQIGLLFAQNSSKPPASPFSFQSGQPISRENVLQNATPIVAANSNYTEAFQAQNAPPANDAKPLEQSEIDNFSDNVIKVFEEKMEAYATRLIPYTLRLFYTLLILSLILTVVTQMIIGNHFKDIIISLVFVFFTAGFFILLIENWIFWSDWIVNYFKDIGENISQVNLQPSEILEYSIKYIKAIFDNLTFTNIGQSLMYVLLAVPTFFLIVQMAAVYIFALLEFIIIGKLSVIYLAFAGIKYTDGYAKKPLMYCLACGLKLMFLQLFFGGALSIIADFSTKQISIQLAMVMFICSVILNLLVQKLPQIVDTFIHGTTSATMGGNLSNMTKALRSVALGTAKSVMNAMDSKKLIESASDLASDRTAYNEKMSKYVEQLRQSDIERKSNISSTNSDVKSTSLNSNNAGSSLNNQQNASLNSQPSSKNNIEANNMPNNQQDNKQAINSSSNTSVANSLNNNSKDAGLNSQKSANNSSKEKSMLNKDNSSEIHVLKTAGHLANALIRNDFSLNKAQNTIDSQLHKKQNLNSEQERLWDRIYSGDSPENYSQAQKYIEHGNKMEKDKKYSDEYSDYVQYRKQIYQDSANQLNDFAQDANKIIEPSKDKSEEIKNKGNTNE